jgi:hypothetical protein
LLNKLLICSLKNFSISNSWFKFGSKLPPMKSVESTKSSVARTDLVVFYFFVLNCRPNLLTNCSTFLSSPVVRRNFLPVWVVQCLLNASAKIFS